MSEEATATPSTEGPEALDINLEGGLGVINAPVDTILGIYPTVEAGDPLSLIPKTELGNILEQGATIPTGGGVPLIASNLETNGVVDAVSYGDDVNAILNAVITAEGVQDFD